MSATRPETFVAHPWYGCKACKTAIQSMMRERDALATMLEDERQNADTLRAALDDAVYALGHMREACYERAAERKVRQKGREMKPWTTQDETDTYPTYDSLLLRSVRSLELIGQRTQERDSLRSRIDALRASLDEAAWLLHDLERETSHAIDCPYRHSGPCDCTRAPLVDFLSRIDASKVQS